MPFPLLSGRRPVHLRVLVAVTSAALVAGCSSGVSPAAGPTPGPACRGAEGPLSGYAMSGALTSAILRPIQLCPVRFGPQITMPAKMQRVSWLAGSGDTAVLAEFGTGADRMFLVTGDRPQPVPGLDEPGHAPALAPDGRIAYLSHLVVAEKHRFLVRVYDPTRRTSTTLATFDGPPSGPVWTQDGGLALVTDTGSDDAALTVIDPAGIDAALRDVAGPRRASGAPAHRVAPLDSTAIALNPLADGDLAVVLSDGNAELSRAVVVGSDGRTRTQVDPLWRPVGTTPSGALVVVHRNTREIARLAGPTYTEAVPYGVLPAGDAVWSVAVSARPV